MGKPKGDVDSVVDDLVGGSTPPAAATPAAAAPKQPRKKITKAPAAAAAAAPAAPKRKSGTATAVGGKNFKPSTPAEVQGYLNKGKKAAAGPASNKAKPAPANKAAPQPKKKIAAAAPAAGKKKVPAKKASTANGATRSPKGQGKFYFDPAAKEALMKKLRQVKAPTTTADYAAKHELPTWQVRLAAAALASNKEMKLTKSGAVLTMSPK